MIPLVAAVQFSGRNRSFRLWIPLALIWLLLLPIALLLLPIVFVACWVGRIDPIEALSVFWGILCGLKGAKVEFGEGRSSVLIHVF